MVGNWWILIPSNAKAEALALARDYADRHCANPARSPGGAGCQPAGGDGQQSVLPACFRSAPAKPNSALFLSWATASGIFPSCDRCSTTCCPQNLQVKDYEVNHDFETIGPKTMRLNARKMVQPQGEDLILLTIEAVSEG